MVTKNGVAILKDCLFVAGLGANLMSVRKACAYADLKGSFDAKTMYLYKDNDIVHTVFHENGIFNINHVLPFKKTELALNSQQSITQFPLAEFPASGTLDFNLIKQRMHDEQADKNISLSRLSCRLYPSESIDENLV